MSHVPNTFKLLAFKLLVLHFQDGTLSNEKKLVTTVTAKDHATIKCGL